MLKLDTLMIQMQRQYLSQLIESGPAIWSRQIATMWKGQQKRKSRTISQLAKPTASKTTKSQDTQSYPTHTTGPITHSMT